MGFQPIDPWRERSGSAAQSAEDPADHCTEEGAIALARRLDAFWAAKGEPKLHEAYEAERAENGGIVWGVRAARPIKPEEPRRIVGKTNMLPPAAEALVRSIVTERHPGVLPEEVLYAAPRARLDDCVTKARRECFKELQAQYGWGRTRTARMFGVDEATVYYALNDAFREKHNRQGKARAARSRSIHATAAKEFAERMKAAAE